MDIISAEGFVLSSIEYKEKSKIVYLFTRNGKISFRALGSNNMKKGLLPLITSMNKLNVIISNSNFPKAIDYTLINSFEYIKNDLKKSLWFSFILEILSKIDENLYNERIYNLVDKLFDLGKEYDGLFLTTIFMIKMTYSFGIAPILKKCVLCGNLNTNGFSIKDGGAICVNHNIKNIYDKKILEMIYNIYYFDIYNDDLNNIKDYDYLELFNLINLYYKTHLDIYLKGLNSLIF